MAMDLNSIMVGSDEPEKMGAFYTLVLGAPNPDWSDAPNGWFGFQAGSSGVVIGPHSEVKGKNEQPGRIMLNFSTADVKGEFERIKDLGAEVIAEPYAPAGGEGMLMCTFADPDGNYFQLSTPWEPASN